MIFWTIVQVALRSLVANKLRSFLAMLGIIIGVWSVISALALASGAQKKVYDQMSSLGTNVVMVTPGQRGSGGVISGNQKNLKVEDAQALLKIPEVARATPLVRGNVQAKHGNRNSRPTLLGAGPTYCAIRSYQVQYGRNFSDADCEGAARVAVLGPTTAQKLFGEAAAEVVGQSVEVQGVQYKVIGLLVGKGDQGFFNPDDQIIIPYTTAMRQVLGMDYLSEVDLSAKDEAQLTTIQTKATLLLRKRHRLADDIENDFNVRNQADVLSATATINTVLSLLLGGIAGISLFVGGIGVMNVMLVTVTERTREIGVRKAIGARRRDILRQFLIESVIMSATGGLIGVALGIFTAKLISSLQSSITLVVKSPSIFVALGFAAAVGIFFGYYPARRAARLDPIEALRYE